MPIKYKWFGDGNHNSDLLNNMDQDLEQLLVAFVEDLNRAVAETVKKHESTVVDAYTQRGGKIDIQTIPAILSSTPHFIALINLLHSARAQLLADARQVLIEKARSGEHVSEPRTMSWLAKGAGRAVKALALPETEESQKRLSVCQGCSEWTGKSCKICGCFVKLKVKIPEEKCPLGKW